MRVSSRRKKHTPTHSIPPNLHKVKEKEAQKNQTRALVVIEQTKVRKKYIQGCKRTIKDLEKAKQEWEDFQNVDVPSYEKWFNGNFGSEISQVREAHAKAQDLHSTLQEIRYWMMKKNISPYDAYRLVMDRKANPEKYRASDEAEAEQKREKERKWNEKFERDFFGEEEENFDEDEEDFFGEDEPSEEDLQRMFEMFINANPSIKSKMKDKGFYDFMFERFKEDVLGKKSSKPGKENIHTSIEDRIKAIYRALVRKLHPDFQTEITPHMQDLWHEVQEAYKAKDLERLETMLAISNIQTGDFSEEISVSQILNVQSEYKNQLKSLRAQIRKAKKKVEWGFSKLTNTQPLSKKIKTELKTELNQHKYHIQEFEKQLSAWSKPMVKVSKNRYVYV
jgi:hypothetical protein